MRLPHTAITLLDLLVHEGPRTWRELLHRTGLASPATIRQQLGELERHHLATARPRPLPPATLEGLATLTPVQRRAWQLRTVGLTVQEISTAMGYGDACSVSTAITEAAQRLDRPRPSQRERVHTATPLGRRVALEGHLKPTDHDYRGVRSPWRRAG